MHLPPAEVLDRAEEYMLSQGFGVPPSARTDTTALFTRIYRQQRQGLLKTLLRSTFGTTPTPKKQRVQLIASEAGEGRTRLTVIESRQGEWPEIQTQLEQWIVEELAGTHWPG